MVWFRHNLTSRQLSREYLGTRQSTVSGVDKGGSLRATGKRTPFPGCWMVGMGKVECEGAPKGRAVPRMTFQQGLRVALILTQASRRPSENGQACGFWFQSQGKAKGLRFCACPWLGQGLFVDGAGFAGGPISTSLVPHPAQGWQLSKPPFWTLCERLNWLDEVIGAVLK